MSEESEAQPIANDAAQLAAAVLDEEARRQEAQAERDAEVVLPDDLLPGVGDTPMTLKEAIATGGASTVVILFLLNFIDHIRRNMHFPPQLEKGIEQVNLKQVNQDIGVANNDVHDTI